MFIFSKHTCSEDLDQDVRAAFTSLWDPGGWDVEGDRALLTPPAPFNTNVDCKGAKNTAQDGAEAHHKEQGTLDRGGETHPDSEDVRSLTPNESRAEDVRSLREQNAALIATQRTLEVCVTCRTKECVSDVWIHFIVCE